MPFPQALGRFNKAVTNRLMIRLASRPPFAALRHQGRRSGKDYRTPLNTWPAGDDFVFALTYGSGTDWVRNVLATGSAELEYEGEVIPLTHPRLIDRSEAWPLIPGWTRSALRLLRVTEFLVMERRVEPAD